MSRFKDFDGLRAAFIDLNERIANQSFLENDPKEKLRLLDLGIKAMEAFKTANDLTAINQALTHRFYGDLAKHIKLEYPFHVTSEKAPTPQFIEALHVSADNAIQLFNAAKANLENQQRLRAEQEKADEDQRKAQADQLKIQNKDAALQLITAQIQSQINPNELDIKKARLKALLDSTPATFKNNALDTYYQTVQHYDGNLTQNLLEAITDQEINALRIEALKALVQVETNTDNLKALVDAKDVSSLQRALQTKMDARYVAWIGAGQKTEIQNFVQTRLQNLNQRAEAAKKAENAQSFTGLLNGIPNPQNQQNYLTTVFNALSLEQQKKVLEKAGAQNDVFLPTVFQATNETELKRALGLSGHDKLDATMVDNLCQENRRQHWERRPARYPAPVLIPDQQNHPLGMYLSETLNVVLNQADMTTIMTAFNDSKDRKQFLEKLQNPDPYKSMTEQDFRQLKALESNTQLEELQRRPLAIDRESLLKDLLKSDKKTILEPLIDAKDLDEKVIDTIKSGVKSLVAELKSTAFVESYSSPHSDEVKKALHTLMDNCDELQAQLDRRVEELGRYRASLLKVMNQPNILPGNKFSNYRSFEAHLSMTELLLQKATQQRDDFTRFLDSNRLSHGDNSALATIETIQTASKDRYVTLDVENTGIVRNPVNKANYVANDNIANAAPNAAMNAVPQRDQRDGNSAYYSPRVDKNTQFLESKHAVTTAANQPGCAVVTQEFFEDGRTRTEVRKAPLMNEASRLLLALDTVANQIKDQRKPINEVKIYLEGKDEQIVADLYHAAVELGISKDNIKFGYSAFHPDRKRGMVYGYETGSPGEKAENLYSSKEGKTRVAEYKGALANAAVMRQGEFKEKMQDVEKTLKETIAKPDDAAPEVPGMRV